MVIEMDSKWTRLGALLGIIASILIILLGIYITPDYVAITLSPDGILHPSTINKINIIRMGAVIAGILILIFSLAPDLIYRILNWFQKLEIIILKNFQNNYILWVAIFLFFAIFLPSGGFRNDIKFFASWSNFVYEHGIADAYKSRMNYQPINIYLFYIIGFYQKYFGNISDTYNILKLIVLIFDMWGIWLITRFTAPKRHIRILLFSFINIAFWYNTLIWGQIDSIFSTLAFASVYMAIKGNIKNALMFMLLSLNFKLQAIIFVPIILIFLLPFLYKPFHLKGIMVVLTSLLFTQLAIIFPNWLHQELGQVKNVITESIDYYPVVSMNAYNFWELLLEGNLITLKDNIVVNGLSYKNWGLLMFFVTSFIALTPLLIITFRKRNDEFIFYSNNQNTLNIIFLSCGLIPLLFFFFNTQMHERYSHPALLFIFAFSYVNKNCIPLMLFSIAYFLNLEGVLHAFKRFGLIDNPILFSRSFIATYYAILILYMFFYLYKLSIKGERIFSKSSINNRQEEGKQESSVEAFRTYNQKLR
jgi:hypothetical protein